VTEGTLAKSYKTNTYFYYSYCIGSGGFFKIGDYRALPFGEPNLMAGHSKWANIKRRKAAQDAKKGVSYAKISREIIVAAKMGGGDPAANFRLRTAIDKAKASGIPNDNIKRAIEKGTGAGGIDNSEDLTYEGYGPGGVAVLIEAVTDNRNRTAGDIRSYFNKYNGNLGSDGCVAWIFKEQGLIQVDSRKRAEEDVFELALESGAQDFQVNEEEQVFEILTSPDDLNTVCQQLTNQQVDILSAEVTRVPENTVKVTDTVQATQLMKLLDMLESHDDVQAVYANFEMEETLLEQVNS
jgi:YebC/PmpR family DNA-binding regulatory protein